MSLMVLMRLEQDKNEAVYKLWTEMTEYQRNLITNITYYGEVNNAEADKNN